MTYPPDIDPKGACLCDMWPPAPHCPTHPNRGDTMNDKTNDLNARHEQTQENPTKVFLTDVSGNIWYHNGEDEWATDLEDGVWATLPLRALHRLHGPLTTGEEEA